ncbi:MAG: tetratricopeptide repeat protein [Candidatus Obscuribacterales bacterium]|nr:tetratricopeptide repeat protein [Steroidobacteraceae bacterium]
MALRISTVFFCLASLLVLQACGGAEARKARYIEHGKEYLAESNLDKARVEFSNAAQIDPKDAEARYFLGSIAEKRNDPRDAVGQYQAAMELDPKNVDARAALARLYLFGGLADKAMELAEEGLKDAPNNAKLMVVRAAVKMRTGDSTGAFADAEQAAKSAPDDPYAIALLASLYKQSERLGEATEIVLAGLEKLPKNVDLRMVLADLELSQQHQKEAEAQLKKVIELEPAKLSHRYQLARLHLLGKNIDAAEGVMREAVTALPKESEAKLALVDFLSAQRGAEQAEKQIEKFVTEQPKDTGLRLALGAYYERRNEPTKAESSYREVMKQAGTESDGLSARNRLAAMMVSKNNLDAAVPLVEEVLKVNPRDADALILRGNISLARGDAPKAITDLRAVLRDQPNALPVMRALARAHVQNKETSLAEETLRAAVQINPKDPQVRLDLAQLLAQNNKAPQAKVMLEELSAEAPTNVGILENLFRLQFGERDFKSAAKTATHIQEVQPDRAAGYYLAGLVAEAEQKRDVAMTAYQRALDKQPQAAEPLTALVRMDIADKKTERALARLEQLIVREPTHAVAHNLQGELLISKGNFDEAARVFRKAIELSPTWWVPYRGLSLAEIRAKRNDAAVQALEAGIQKATGAVVLTADLAALHERLGHTDQAIAAYEDLARREPRSLFVANNLAMLLVNYRSDKTSLERAQQLAEVLATSDDAAMLNTRGWIKFKAGSHRDALPLLQQAVEKSPKSPLLRYHLAMAQLKTGEQLEAKKNLEAAVGAGQQFFGIDEAKAALAQIKT